MNNIQYRGYELDSSTFPGVITVYICGDEVAFKNADDARAFIDEMEDKGVETW